MNDGQGLSLKREAVVDEAGPSLPELDPNRIDNVVLRNAIARIQSRALPDAHADYYTKHSSHQTHSKGW